MKSKSSLTLFLLFTVAQAFAWNEPPVLPPSHVSGLEINNSIISNASLNGTGKTVSTGLIAQEIAATKTTNLEITASQHGFAGNISSGGGSGAVNVTGEIGGVASKTYRGIGTGIVGVHQTGSIQATTNQTGQFANGAKSTLTVENVDGSLIETKGVITQSEGFGNARQLITSVNGAAVFTQVSCPIISLPGIGL